MLKKKKNGPHFQKRFRSIWRERGYIKQEEDKDVLHRCEGSINNRSLGKKDLPLARAAGGPRGQEEGARPQGVEGRRQGAEAGLGVRRD